MKEADQSNPGLQFIIWRYRSQFPTMRIDIENLDEQESEEELTRIGVGQKSALSSIWVTAKRHSSGEPQNVEGPLTVAHVTSPDYAKEGTHCFSKSINFADLGDIKNQLVMEDCDCAWIYNAHKREDLMLAAVNQGNVNEIREKFILNRSVNMTNAHEFHPFNHRHEELMTLYDARITLPDRMTEDGTFEVFKSKTSGEWQVNVRMNVNSG